MFSIRTMIPTRTLGMIAALATVTGLTLGAATAQATPTVQAPAGVASTGAKTLIAPPAPPGATAVRLAAAATSPWTTPETRSIHVASGGGYTCDYGNFCAAVWDPTTGNYEVFFFGACAEYSLYYWNGGGNYFDNQYGAGAVTYFYDVNHAEISHNRTRQVNIPFNWGPVYGIRNCWY
jgi:hypothetical protein